VVVVVGIGTVFTGGSPTTSSPPLPQPCSGGRACAPRLQGAERSDSRGRRAALPESVQGGRSAAQSARTRAACRKRRPRSPRSPALGRTHNDGAPVLKVGQGHFSEIATFTLDSGPRPRCPLDSSLYRETVLPNDADTHEPTQIDVWQYPARRAAEIRYAHCGKTASSSRSTLVV
jgi:hypothetical protein